MKMHKELTKRLLIRRIFSAKCLDNDPRTSINQHFDIAFRSIVETTSKLPARQSLRSFRYHQLTRHSFIQLCPSITLEIFSERPSLPPLVCTKYWSRKVLRSFFWISIDHFLAIFDKVILRKKDIPIRDQITGNKPRARRANNRLNNVPRKLKQNNASRGHPPSRHQERTRASSQQRSL